MTGVVIDDVTGGSSLAWSGPTLAASMADALAEVAYKANRRPGVDALIDALAVCAKHQLEVIDNEHVPLQRELPEKRLLDELAHAANITPAQLIRAWDAIVAFASERGKAR